MKITRSINQWILACAFSLACASCDVGATETVTLEQLLTLLDQHNPSLAAANARQDLALGAMTTAKAYPNPELELAGGSSTGIGPGALNGGNQLLYMSQALDLPFVRAARQAVAESGINAADQANRAVLLLVRAKTQQAFYEILRRQAELSICQDNEHLLEQIRDKVALKVEVGEASRYEVVKAEAELLNAVKLRTSAAIMVEDSKSALRALFANILPDIYEAQGELPQPPTRLPHLNDLRTAVLEQQPLLQHAWLEVKKAKANVDLQQQMRYPQPVLKAGVERDPGLEQWRVGISLPLPLWNQRQGPIAEAEAELRQSEAEATQQQLAVMRELENAYNRYQMAQRQIDTFESGLLTQAEKALQIAEAAYRLGQRGILDYLDAQRSYRSVRNDYINARFDRQQALIDLERLNADPITG